MLMELQEEIHDIYYKIRLGLSQAENAACAAFDTLTSVEKVSMETITSLGSPTVAEFARALNISPPNAAYRVAGLMKKGFLMKSQDKEDRRKFFLVPKKRYLQYVRANETYIRDLSERIRERFSDEDYNRLVDMLGIIDKELMGKNVYSGEGKTKNGTAEERRSKD